MLWLILLAFCLTLITLTGGVGVLRGDDELFPEKEELPRIDVLIPFKDEEKFLPQKFANLASLDYPPDLLTFYLVDGGSRDRSVGIARAWERRDSRVTVLVSAKTGKVEQLGAALRLCCSELALITDADCLLDRSTLKMMVRRLEDPMCGAVGTMVTPAGALRIEKLYWSILNWVRRAESRAGCSSSLLAPAYLYRRALSPSIPADVVADDLFVSFKVMSEGYLLQCAPVVALECRTPKSFGEFLLHKFRKGRAYGRELARFIPAICRMAPEARLTFLARLIQFVCVPATILAAAILIGAKSPAVVLSIAVLGALAPFAEHALMPRALRFVSLGLWLVLLSAAALISIPLPQSSAYRRIGSV